MGCDLLQNLNISTIQYITIFPSGLRNSLGIGFLLFLLSPFFFIKPVYAYGNIHLGRLGIEPEITFKVEYNDNIYSEKTNEDDDYISTLTPIIRFLYIGSDFFNANAGYSVDLAAYSDNSDNNYQVHRPFISVDIKTPAGLYLKFNDNYLHTADPYGTDNQYKLGVPRTERWNNSATVIAGFRFAKKFAIEGRYKNYMEGFKLDEDKWQKRTDYIYGTSFFFKVTGKISLLANYRQGVTVYDKQNDGVNGWSDTTSQDNTFSSYFIGFRFEPGGKLSGEIKLGLGNKNYDNEVDKNGNNYKDIDSWVAETNVNFQARAKTIFTLNLQRSLKGSPDSDAASYIDTQAGLNLSQKLLNRLFLNLGFDWINNDYQNEISGIPEKYFNIYTARCGFGYNKRDWLMVYMGYQYKSKYASDKAYEQSEFNNNIFSFRLSMLF